jgi:hypothetical protein
MGREKLKKKAEKRLKEFKSQTWLKRLLSRDFKIDYIEDFINYRSYKSYWSQDEEVINSCLNISKTQVGKCYISFEALETLNGWDNRGNFFDPEL